MNKNKILIVNQVFWPDSINTARHISELAFELSKHGWDVSALISNRSYINNKIKFTPKVGSWNNVKYYRTFTLPLNQKNDFNRLFTAFLLIITWSFKQKFFRKFDVIIIGTNPPFSYFLVPIIKLFNKKIKIVMWGFDLYPEAISISGGKFRQLLSKIIVPITKVCYSKLDAIIDIGPCMKERLKKYSHNAITETITPWAFVEPSEMLKIHEETRRILFGNAKLTLLYSGTIGNAHEFDNFLTLSRELKKRNTNIKFCFAGFGNKFDSLKSKIKPEDDNVVFAGFVNSDLELENRLSSADLMLISLKQEWTGISVPSKFFGAIATGNAVLFSGSNDSSIAKWINEFNIGYSISKENIVEIADSLCDISNNHQLIMNLRENAFKTYQQKFSKEVACLKWHNLIKNIINQ